MPRGGFTRERYVFVNPVSEPVIVEGFQMVSGIG